MQDFGTYTINTFLPPAAPLRININQGWEYMRITNKTPFALVVDFGAGNIIQFPEMYLEDLPLPNTFTGWVIITPRIDLTNTLQSISGIVTVGAWQKGELVHPQAQPLTQQAVNTTASGKPVFSANADFSNTATTGQSLNLFNPANSGTILIIYQVTVYTNDSGFPGANLFEFMGADNNFANPVNIISHQVSSNPPVSVAHATSQDSASTPPGTVAEVIRCQQFAPNNMPIFPDDNKLYPGGNFTLNIAGTASGKIVHLTIKWTENQVVPPTLVTGATAVASSIDNEGNPVGTSIIKSGITGVGNPIQIFNDGSSAWLVDASGVLHKVITTNLAANFLQLGQAGDITEVLGQLLIDQLATANAGIKTTGSTSPAIDLSASTGAIALKLLVGTASRVSVFTGSASSSGNLQAHGLGIKPDWVGLIETDTVGDSNNFAWDTAASDATNIKVWGNNATARGYVALAFKL